MTHSSFQPSPIRILSPPMRPLLRSSMRARGPSFSASGSSWPTMAESQRSPARVTPADLSARSAPSFAAMAPFMSVAPRP